MKLVTTLFILSPPTTHNLPTPWPHNALCALFTVPILIRERRKSFYKAWHY